MNLINQLNELADKWFADVKQTKINAARMNEPPEDRPTGRIMTEHGATCIFHCAYQLKEVLDSFTSATSETPKKMKSKQMSQS